MKPPYLNKLSKKQLKKEYTRQWREAIRANGEIYLGNITNDQLHEVIRQQEHEINIKSIALTEHFWRIEELKETLADTQEALSRSRQLRTSLQELADRKHWEKAKIEDMAKNLLIRLCEQESASSQQIADDLGITIQEVHTTTWDELTEDERDDLRVQVTHIISHLPTDEKRKTTTEGSPE